jgi:hypothetical protein
VHHSKNRRRHAAAKQVSGAPALPLLLLQAMHISLANVSLRPVALISSCQCRCAQQPQQQQKMWTPPWRQMKACLLLWRGKTLLPCLSWH